MNKDEYIQAKGDLAEWESVPDWYRLFWDFRELDARMRKVKRDVAMTEAEMLYERYQHCQGAENPHRS